MPDAHARRQQTYDHRLRDLARTTGDPDILAELGVPRSTALGWLRRDHIRLAILAQRLGKVFAAPAT